MSEKDKTAKKIARAFCDNCCLSRRVCCYRKEYRYCKLVMDTANHIYKSLRGEI
jgi:hypothetical protein